MKFGNTGEIAENAAVSANDPVHGAGTVNLPFDFTGKPGSRATDGYDLPASIRGAPDATLRKGRPATGGTISILTHGGTRINTDPTKFPVGRGRKPMPPEKLLPPEGTTSGAGYRTVRRSPSSRAAVLPSRERARLPIEAQVAPLNRNGSGNGAAAMNL